MMSAAEFWWNGLTNDQRRFIATHCDEDLKWNEVAEYAFKCPEQFHDMPG